MILLISFGKEYSFNDCFEVKVIAITADYVLARNYK